MNQKQLTETVRKFFDHIEWQYDFDETDNYFMTGSRFEGGVEYCNVIVDVEDEFVHCYAVVPFEVPAERRADAAEFVTRANSGMKRGAFELNYADGEVRFHTYMDVPEGAAEPSEIQLVLLTQAPIAMIQRYGMGLKDVAEGTKTPAQAVAEAETRS